MPMLPDLRAAVCAANLELDRRKIVIHTWGNVSAIDRAQGLIVIKPYDPSSLPAIEKAILAANIGVTPLNDGRLIRVPIPELSEERRKELTKVANRMGEEARVALRSVRRDANEAVKTLEKAATISQDDRDRALEEVQKYTDSYSKKVDELIAAKEKDIMAV